MKPGIALIWSAATRRRFPTGRSRDGGTQFQSADMSAHSKLRQRLKRPSQIFFLSVFLGLAGCAHPVQTIPDFAAIRVAGDTVTFVSAPNRLPMHDSSGAVVGSKTLHRGESLRLIDQHGTIEYQVRRIAPEKVVLKESVFFQFEDDVRRRSEVVSVKPYEPSK